MTSRFSTKTASNATGGTLGRFRQARSCRLPLTICTLLTLAVVAGAGPPLLAAPVHLPTGSQGEVVLSPPSRLPLLGPRYAAVTIDLFFSFDHSVMAPNLALLRRLAHEASDVRLRFHPVLGSEEAERGAELLFSVWQQRSSGEPCFAFALALATHRDWLKGTQEAEQALRVGVAELGLGIDGEQLSRSLRQRAQRALVAGIWQSEQSEVRSPPEVWLNGRRIRGPLGETQLREELERQRARSYQALRSGTPVSRIYEQQLAKERGEQNQTSPTPRAAGLPLRFDLAGSPSRGPKVSPATLVLIGSLDTSGTFGVSLFLPEVWGRHRETVRLVVQQAPTTENGRRVALLLGQLGLTDPPAFWRSFDGIQELMKRRSLLRYSDIVELLEHQGKNVAQLEAAVRDPLRSEAVRTLLSRDLAQAQRLALPSMAQLLLNGRPIPPPQSAEQLERLVEAELERGTLSRWLAPRK